MILQATVAQAADRGELLYQCPFLYDAKHHISVPVTQAKDGWFFRVMELKENFSLLPETADFLKRLDTAFKHEGSTLVLMQVPLRGMGASAFLLKDQPLQSQFNVALSARNYGRYLQSLRDTGIPVVSMLAESQQVDGNTGLHFFMKRDIHWSPYGASVAAGKVAEVIHALPAYKGITPVEYQTTQTEMIGKKDIFARELQELCTDILPPEEFPVYTTVKKEGDATGEAALFGEEDGSESQSMVVLGSSFSALKDFNFEGFLAEKTKMEIVNFAMSAGELFNAIISYTSLSKEERLSPKFVLWENLAHYDLNQGERMFRQVIPAIEGECSAEEAIATQKLEIKQGQGGTVFTLDPAQNIWGHDYYFYIHSDNLGLARFTLNLDYTDGDGEWFTVDRTEHFNNTGRFFAELSDEITTPLKELSISGMDDLNATVEIRLCKSKYASADEKGTTP